MTRAQVMPTPAKNEAALCGLLRLFARGRRLTAAQVSVKMRCSRPVAHARLKTLVERGCRLEISEVREGKKGPPSSSYKLKPNRASRAMSKATWAMRRKPRAKKPRGR